MSLQTRIIYPFVETWQDYPDSVSNAVLVYFVGCDNYCKGCHNHQLINYYNNDARSIFLGNFIEDLNNMCTRCNTDKVVLSGGDPLYCKNVEFVKSFLVQNNLSVTIYTGYDYSYVKRCEISGFDFIKVGKFIPEESQPPAKSDTFLRLASKNQKIYNKDLIEVTDGNGVFFF